MAGGIEDYAVDIQPDDSGGGSSAGTYAAGAGALIGLGAAAFGGFSSSQAAQKSAAAQQQIIQLEQQVQEQHRQAMELNSRRAQMEVLRNNQRARSMALNSATNQGAQFGSGLQGGYGEIGGESGTNMLGINQNLEIGRNIFSDMQQISQQKIAMSKAKSQEATGSAIAGFGKQLGSSIEPLARLGMLLL